VGGKNEKVEKGAGKGVDAFSGFKMVRFEDGKEGSSGDELDI
jgi:hypothetical protein